MVRWLLWWRRYRFRHCSFRRKERDDRRLARGSWEVCSDRSFTTSTTLGRARSPYGNAAFAFDTAFSAKFVDKQIATDNLSLMKRVQLEALARSVRIESGVRASSGR